MNHPVRAALIVALSLAVPWVESTVCWAADAAPDTYLPPQDVVPYGDAPHAKEHLVSRTSSEETYSLILSDGDEVITGLTDFAKRHHVTAAHFTGIGAVHDAKVGWLDRGRNQYKVINVDGQMEVLSLVGDIGDVGGKPAVHAHIVLGGSTGEARGGHLMHAVTSPTLEIFVSTENVVLEKQLDATSGLTLFR